MARDDSGERRDPRRSDSDRGIGAARRYTPRGQSMRDAADDRRRRAATSRRSERDAFRPALRLVEGGAAKQSQSRTAAARERARRKAATATPAARIPAARNTRTRQAPRGPAARGNPTRRRVIKRRLPRIGDPHRRLRFATVAMLLIFVVTGGRLIQLQVTDAAAYAADALDQRLVEEVIPGSRGAILDRDGRLLAFSAEARYVFADPTKVEKHEETAELLTPLLGIPASELVDRMMPRTRSDGTDSEFEYLARGVDISVGDAIQELNLPGIHVAYDERREVPGHDLAANIIGFVGTDGEGLYGLEARCEGILKGVDGERRYEKSASGQRIPGGYYREEPAQPGDDLQLTIDSDLQYEVQRILADTVAAKDAEFGAAVVMDSATGEIVALASAPTYDAADPGDYEPEDRIDWATAAVVDPGSSHKALVVGAALEEGVIDADTQLTVAPYTHKGDVRFEDSHYHVERPMSIGGILAHSSNVGTIMLADELGAQTLYDYQLKFGLGSPTAIGMPAEAAGLVQPPENWSGSSYGSIPIGHGVAVTPLQMAAGYSAIANDGVYIQPTLIKGTVDAEGDLSPYQTPQTHRLFSTETAKDLQYLLQGPVAVPDGTGTAARLDDYLVAGKTGTGLLTKDNEYAPGEVANFVGFAPADEPRYTVAVFAYTPGGGGGAVTGEAFGDIMKFTLEHFRVPPSSEAPADITVFP